MEFDVRDCDHYVWSGNTITVAAGAALVLPVAIRGPVALVNFLILCESMDVELSVTLNDGAETVTLMDPQHINNVKDSMRINAGRDVDSMVLSFRISNDFSWLTDKRISYKIEAYVPRLKPSIGDALRHVREAEPQLALTRSRLREASDVRQAADSSAAALKAELAELQQRVAAAVHDLHAARAVQLDAEDAEAAASRVWNAKALTAALSVMLHGAESQDHKYAALLRARQRSTPSAGPSPPSAIAAPTAASVLAEQRIGYLSPADICAASSVCHASNFLLRGTVASLRAAAAPRSVASGVSSSSSSAAAAAAAHTPGPAAGSERSAGGASGSGAAGSPSGASSSSPSTAATASAVSLAGLTLGFGSEAFEAPPANAATPITLDLGPVTAGSLPPASAGGGVGAPHGAAASASSSAASSGAMLVSFADEGLDVLGPVTALPAHLTAGSAPAAAAAPGSGADVGEDEGDGEEEGGEAEYEKEGSEEGEGEEEEEEREGELETSR
jgi:hypothetical protein